MYESYTDSEPKLHRNMPWTRQKCFVLYIQLTKWQDHISLEFFWTLFKDNSSQLVKKLRNKCPSGYKAKSVDITIFWKFMHNVPWVPGDIFFLWILMVAQSAEEKKITSGHRSMQPHFHVISGSNISPNRFWAPWEGLHVCLHEIWQLTSDCTWRSNA